MLVSGTERFWGYKNRNAFFKDAKVTTMNQYSLQELE